MHISAFGAALRTPDLRKKILFTLGLLGLYRLGAVLPTPGVDYAAIQRCIDVVQDNSVYALINLFSGGALLQLSVFALGIMPYITASIILQLLTVVIPRLETLKKDGQAGQAKITQYTRYVTIGLAVLQSTAILSLARTPGALFSGCNETIIPNQGIWVILVMVIVMTAGTLGLDAAVPAGFIALLWPRLRDRSTIALAVVSAAVAIALVPVLRPGLPVLSAVLVALVAERLMARGLADAVEGQRRPD